MKPITRVVGIAVVSSCFAYGIFGLISAFSEGVPRDAGGPVVANEFLDSHVATISNPAPEPPVFDRFAWDSEKFAEPFTVDTLAQFDPPPVNACPRRFLAVGAYSQLNNNIFSLIRGLVLAAIFNRTLVFSNSVYPIAGMFDYSQHCISFDAVPAGLDVDALKKRPVRTFVVHHEDDGITKYHDFDVERVVLDRRLLEPAPLYPQLSTVARMIPGYELSDPLIYLNLLFYTRISKDLYVDVVSKIPFHPDIVKAGDEFIQAHFGNEPFLGVHARLFEGACIDISRDLSAADKEIYAHVCDLRWEWAASQLKQAAPDQDIEQLPIFYASDRQNGQHDANWKSHDNVHMYNGENSIIMDMYILSRSAWFIGNPYSTFAVNVACYRESFGRHFGTNIILFYDGTSFPFANLR